MKITRNTKVRLTANPDEDYKFKQWNNGITANPYITTVSNIISYRNKLAAIFELNRIPSGSNSGSGEDPVEPIEPIGPIDTSCPLDEIWYTTADEDVIDFVQASWGANVISNTYENGKGIIKFDNDVLYCPDSAFADKNLKTIVLPNNIYYIGADAFASNTNLIFVKLPENAIELRSGCFKYCTSLTNVIVPNKVTQIYSYAFFGCSRLTDVTLGEKVSEVKHQVFCSCNNLSSITILNTTVPAIPKTYVLTSDTTNRYTNALNAGFRSSVSSEQHISVNRLCPIYVPNESLLNYKNSDWNRYWSGWRKDYQYTTQQRNILPIENNEQ